MQGEEYRAFTYTIGVDILALSGAGSARDRVEVRALSVSKPLCGLVGHCRIRHSGNWLHRQDQVK